MRNTIIQGNALDILRQLPANIVQILGRDYLGIELSPTYIKMAKQRIAEARPA